MMQEIEQLITAALGQEPESLYRLKDVPNNKVYIFEAAGNSYILKFFKGNWPEDGKLAFVNRMLSQNSIPNAELIIFSRENEQFSNGYLIEGKIPGITADKMSLDKKQEKALYTKLGALLSKVHCIPVKNFGYIGNGEADYDTMLSFFEDEFDNRVEDLLNKKVFKEFEIEQMKQRVFSALKDTADLPSVLCHGDLSKKNIVVKKNGELVLIDWDDAMAYHWMADVARFTFWMKFVYSPEDYELFRAAFLENYHSDYRKEAFDDFEKRFHLYIGLDCLSYHINCGNEDMSNHIQSYLTDLMIL